MSQVNSVYLQKKQIIQFTNKPIFLNTTCTASVLESFIDSYNYKVKRLSYNFVSKDFLYEMNMKHLSHNTDTDIITFDYTAGNQIEAEIFISSWAIDRAASIFKQSPVNETLRLLSHGVLHCMSYKDASIEDKKQMRSHENKFIQMFHVKHKDYV